MTFLKQNWFKLLALIIATIATLSLYDIAFNGIDVEHTGSVNVDLCSEANRMIDFGFSNSYPKFCKENIK